VPLLNHCDFVIVTYRMLVPEKPRTFPNALTLVTSERFGLVCGGVWPM
jgi:hypothetical protein